MLRIVAVMTVELIKNILEPMGWVFLTFNSITLKNPLFQLPAPPHRAPNSHQSAEAPTMLPLESSHVSTAKIPLH